MLDWTGLRVYWTGLDCTILDWSGLDYIGLDLVIIDCTGLDCIGLDLMILDLLLVCIPDGDLHRVTYTRCRIDTINSPDDEHMSA
jgi:hypothetical protein